MSTIAHNGNTRSKSGPSGATTYRYDDANRLVEAVTPEGTSSYVYTADGLRVRQTHTPQGGTATTTWYVQDTAYPYAQVIEEYTSTPTTPKTLAATFTFADELVSQTRYANGTPTTRFIQFDGFGSTRWLTDAAGAITDTIDYDAFGNEVSRTGTTAIEHLYRGEAFDPNVGLYNLRARWMDPSVGRFTRPDSWPGLRGSPTTLHKYLFADAEPVNNVDPSGMTTMPEQSMVARAQAAIQSQASVVYRQGIRDLKRFTNHIPRPFFMLKRRSGYDRHHIIERRFMNNLALRKTFFVHLNLLAIHLRRTDHLPFTLKWRSLLPYSPLRPYSLNQIENAAKIVYFKDPILLFAVRQQIALARLNEL